MTKEQLKAVLARVPTWPDHRQRELAKVALEIEAELAGAEYDATPGELAAIDEGLAGDAASDHEVKAAFAVRPLRRSAVRGGWLGCPAIYYPRGT
jgi:hypothetical protein